MWTKVFEGNKENLSSGGWRLTKVDPDLRDLLPAYLERRRKDLAVLKVAAGKSDAATVQLIGHRIAGNAGSFSLDSLGHLGRELETTAKMGDWASVEKTIEAMETLLSNIKL